MKKENIKATPMKEYIKLKFKVEVVVFNTFEISFGIAPEGPSTAT